MTTIKNFEELEIWKMARELVNLVYSDFRECRDFGFRDQITRAGISTRAMLIRKQPLTEEIGPRD